MVDYIDTAPIAKRTAARFFGQLNAQMRAHALLVISCLVFFVTAAVVNTALGQKVGLSAMPYLEMVFVIMVPVMFMASLIAVFLQVFLYMALVRKPKHLLPAMVSVYKPLLTDPARWAKAVPAIGIMMLGFMAYTDLKGAIPLLNPFSWDVSFMQLDRAQNFGQDPWRLLQPILGSSWATLGINFIYNLWFFVMFGFWLRSGWTAKDQGWERQFLLSFLWCWMLGGAALAILFSSMGSAFYDLIDPANNPYAAQMAFLSSIDAHHTVLALETQEVLREAYLDPKPGVISGISAMPSLHNATSTIFMLAAYRIHKVFGHVILAFLICILLGSVHLAWHFAVDAYLGIALALMMWALAGRAIACQDRKLAITR